MSALVLVVTMAYITERHSIRPVHPLRFIRIGGCILDIYHNDYRFFWNRLHQTQAFLQKMLTSLIIFSPTTITGPPSRMDAVSVAAVTGCAGEPRVVMAYHCLVSVWMRDHAISTAGCSMMAPTIMSVSMGKEESGVECTKTGNWKHWSRPSKLKDGVW